MKRLLKYFGIWCASMAIIIGVLVYLVGTVAKEKATFIKNSEVYDIQIHTTPQGEIEIGRFKLDDIEYYITRIHDNGYNSWALGPPVHFDRIVAEEIVRLKK